MNDTLVEVRNAVLTYLLQQPVFDVKEHLGLIDFTCEDQELKTALVELIFVELSKIEMVTSIETSTTKYWVLNKHLKMYDQNVSIGYATALSLAEVVNKYCQKIGNQKEICDGSCIKERDIQKLILILEDAIQK